jgi:hypothetical protein
MDTFARVEHSSLLGQSKNDLVKRFIALVPVKLIRTLKQKVIKFSEKNESKWSSSKNSHSVGKYYKTFLA